MSRGGYRWGAGRPAHRHNTANMLSLPIHRLRQAGLLVGWTSRSWVWSRGDERVASANVAIDMERRSLVLSYSTRSRGDDWRPVRHDVAIQSTPCRYGGQRHWYTCPRCHRRIGVLYFSGDLAGCRTCLRLTYASQCDDVCGRTWRKQSKLEARLGKGWSRPKGMHWRTRENIVNRILDCEQAREDALATFLSMHPVWAGILDL